MHLEELSVAGFRNLHTQKILFPDPVTVLIGKNGQGKTSVLESIYLFSHSRSFRSSTTRDLVRWNSEEKAASAEGVFQTADGRKCVEYQLENGSRKVLVNGKKIESAQAFYSSVRVLEFTPDDLFLVKGEPAVRRLFLDKVLTLIDPVYVEHLVRYQRALKNRNALLLRTPVVSSLSHQLAPFHELLVQHGRVLIERRLALLEELAPAISETYDAIAGTASERVRVVLRSGFLDESHAVLSADSLLEIYGNRLDEDLRHKRTTFGPHRDDLVLRFDTGHGERIARNAASQGQTRSLALAMKMAAVRVVAHHTGDDPILLLDDFESELDSSRKEALNELILGYRSQIIITTTDATNLPYRLQNKALFLEIRDGLLANYERC